MKNKVLLYIFSIILILAGIGMFASGISGDQAELVPITSLSYSELDGKEDYEIAEAIVMDNYATYEENNVPKTHYLAIGFYDLNGNLCMGSLAMDKGDDIYDTVMNYLDDDTMYVGDLVLPMYCSAGTFSESSDVGEYFDEYTQELSSAGFYVQPVYIQMHYMGATLAEYSDEQTSSSTGAAIMGAIFLVLGVLVLVLTKRMDKKAKAAKEAQAAAFAAANVYAAPPAPAAPTYTAPATPAAPAAPKVCPTCGEKVKSGAAFCGNCGTRLG